MTCAHIEFDFKCKVTFLTNVQRYILECAVRCAKCRERFAFSDLPVQPISLNGACMTPDGGIAKFSIYPMRAALPPLDDMPIASLPEKPDDFEPDPPADADFSVIE